LNREDLFVTSKVWNDHLTYDQTIAEFNNSLDKLGLDYLDLYLIHWPGDNSFKDSYQALEDLYKAGKIKAIGVSNFEIHHLKELAEFADITPVLNQVESHPRMSQNNYVNMPQEMTLRSKPGHP
jgi:Aldo/keto reductases, related to diketogulonate reductase